MKLDKCQKLWIKENIEIARKEIDDNNIFIENTITILSKFQNGDLSQRLNVEVDVPKFSKIKICYEQNGRRIRTKYSKCFKSN